MSYTRLSVPSRGTIVLADSDCDFARALRENLELEGYRVYHVTNGPEALALLGTIAADLLILDLDLPEMDGLDLLRHLRSAKATLPVIVLTARNDEVDRVAALRFGADDYVTKPFHLMELLERLKIHLRHARHSQHDPDREVQIGDVVVDLDTRISRRGTQETRLGPKEFQVLDALVRAGGSVVTREQLLKEVWGFECEIDTRRVDFQVSILREKIEEDPAHPAHLLTVRGVGFRLI